MLAEQLRAGPLTTLPSARLVNAFDAPFNNAVATARTCYSSRIITPEDVAKDDRSRALRDRIAASTYLAGHHTTLQHATFQFALENVSRQAVWSFLHAHPYYNSEQVSQRYVAVKAERALIPRFGHARLQAQYEACVREQMDAYHELTELLMVPASEAYFAIFPARRKMADKFRGAIVKKAQEIARYVLPIATYAHLYHTISGLTLHRYHRLSRMLDVPTEVSYLVDAMVEAVAAHDPLFFRDMEDPILLEQTHEYALLAKVSPAPSSANAKAFAQRFDASLQGRWSVLLDSSQGAEATLAGSVREVLALLPEQLSDDDAIEAVMHPKHSPYLGEALNLTAHGKLTRALVHPHYTFRKKLSHAADSQDQRHRTTPGTRPVLSRHYAGGAPDVIEPVLLAHSGAAQERFRRSVSLATETIDALLHEGVDHELALYLLPNATSIRFTESGDLMGWHHKWVSRLCYNAQEEIWRASLDEVRAVCAVHPRIGRHLLPPCGVRVKAGTRPICPEGTRFCGVPVWKLPTDAYERII